MAIDRREFLQLAALTAGHRAFELHASGVPLAADDLTQFVRISTGTGGHGHTFPGATVPFGAVQVSPDTGTQGWDWSSGYYYDDNSILGFSHTHLSGTGVGDMLDVLLVPRTGAVKLDPGSKENPEDGYRSRYTHADEHAVPGYYSVLLQSSGGKTILAELTATERTGLHRYTFPTGEEAHILLDLHHAFVDGADPVLDADVRIGGKDLILGGRRVNRWAPHREIYFATQFSVAPTSVQIYSDNQPVKQSVAHGKNLKVVMQFPTATKLLAKTGISMVSAENALANLNAEMPEWDFDGTSVRAKEKWQRELARIRIKTEDPTAKRVFYTSMYHMMCAPTLADDANGQYRGMDGKVHDLTGAHEHNYSTFSLWDTFRALHPSFTLWQSERVPGMVNCLVRMAEESPAGMPIWPLQAKETFCMTGYHSASVMAEACAKGFTGIDWNRAYNVMRKRNMDDDYMGLGYYRKLGYIPADLENESVSKALEYMYNDWACARVAQDTGHKEDAEIQLKRARNYKNLFDPKTQFIRAKLMNGEWTPNFDPKATGHIKKYRDYTESNAWQTTFFAQHDVAGYIELFGGREQFARKLDALFAESPGVSNEDVPDMTGFIGQYVHGNEPSHHIAYLYVYAGQPNKTQQYVRQILKTLYRDNPDGLAGNEDCGQMSAWYVMSSMGLYAVDPVSATYVLGSPLV
ncbi:MAG TPA: GH92 family glycosyl hydrolase, partial [Acidobacteriaceae bacterium]|nr:GH92 family glycosyl hydrolase [Acidobacteriaceae bacterium]